MRLAELKIDEAGSWVHETPLLVCLLMYKFLNSDNTDINFIACMIFGTSCYRFISLHKNQHYSRCWRQGTSLLPTGVSFWIPYSD